jgi:tetratricopeptide (TPR) repeat protein
MLRWSLERGVAILLRCLAEHTRDLALFFDAYELADETSVALFKSLGARSAGWPMPVIVAWRDKGGAAWRPEAEIRLGPLADDAAGELLDRLTHGAQLPEVLRRDVLARAAGIPLHIEEMVRMLVRKGILTPAKDGTGWICEPHAVSAPLLVSYREAIIDQLEQPARDVLCQCAVQGTEFDLDVIEAVQRRMNWRGPSVRTLLPALERHGLVQSVSDDGPAQWSFSQPFIQEACYKALAPCARRTLHGKTAEALCELTGGQESVPPELLAYHYERAGQWTPAAAATLRAGHCASEVFLNEVAVRLYQRAADMFDRLAAPSEEAIRLAILAHGGAARVHLRVGAYGLVEQDIKKMRAIAVQPGDRAEADRLAALAYSHTGRTDEAERLLLNAIALARNDDAAADVLLQALCDLAELYISVGRTDAAREPLRECRTIARSEESLALVRADGLESRIADIEGRFADASALCARAHAAAQRAGNLSELARTSLGLGNTARDLGDYEAAQRHFECALEIWELTGEAEFIAMAYNNLGNLAMSRSDFEAAQAHHERARAACQAIGNIDGAALAQLNLAFRAIEEGDLVGAVTVAEASLAMLNSSGNTLLRGWVLAILGEGRLECGDAPGAQREFDRIIQNYDEAHHPLAVAHAWRGLGRVALMRGAATDALGLLERARAGFERLRAQEAARTALYQAMALRQLGESQRASAVLEQAREQFIAMPMRAERDAERAERLLCELYAAS